MGRCKHCLKMQAYEYEIIHKCFGQPCGAKRLLQKRRHIFFEQLGQFFPTFPSSILFQNCKSAISFQLGQFLSTIPKASVCRVIKFDCRANCRCQYNSGRSLVLTSGATCFKRPISKYSQLTHLEPSHMHCSTSGVGSKPKYAFTRKQFPLLLIQCISL